VIPSEDEGSLMESNVIHVRDIDHAVCQISKWILVA
jgi:hypothetical protein